MNVPSGKLLPFGRFGANRAPLSSYAFRVEYWEFSGSTEAAS